MLPVSDYNVSLETKTRVIYPYGVVCYIGLKENRFFLNVLCVCCYKVFISVLLAKVIGITKLSCLVLVFIMSGITLCLCANIIVSIYYYFSNLLFFTVFSLSVKNEAISNSDYVGFS